MPRPPRPRLRRPAPPAWERDSLRGVLESIGREADLAPLLDRLLAHACALMRAGHGAIALLDDAGTLRAAAVRRLPRATLGCALPAGVGLSGEVLRRGVPVRLRRYGDLASMVVPGLREHAGLGVPVAWGDRLVGVVSLARRGAPFSARDVAALEALAQHAAVAVHNARRYALERRRAERMAVIARVGRLVTADLRLDDLLQHAADAIHELLGYENVAVALLPRDEPGTLVLRSFGGAYKASLGGEHRLPVSRGIMGAAVRARAAVLVNDASADPRYVPTPGTDGRQAELALPLLVGDAPVGVLNVERRAPFGAEDVEHLRVVADQLAVAIENARLHEAARHAAALEERHRLARELHDSVTQQLFTAALVAQSVGAAYARGPAEGGRRAAMLVDVTRSALGEMRALLAELRPAAPGAGAGPGAGPADAGLARLRDRGLVAALEAHLAGGGAGDVAVRLDARAYAPQHPAAEEALYRIAREALHNVVKHARAAHARVRLEAGDARVRLVVEDDGVGLGAAGARRGRAGSLGMQSMRERAAERGGTVRVARAAGRGTVVEVVLPAAGAARAPEPEPETVP